MSVEQMKCLQELGIELRPSVFHYYKIINIDNGKWHLTITDGDISGNATYKYIPAYTLQDVLDMLPLTISPKRLGLFEDKKYELRIKRMVFGSGKVMNAVVYENQDYIDWYVLCSEPSLMDAAYEMLLWCIKNGYIRTRKEVPK